MASQPLKLVYFFAAEDRHLVKQMKTNLSVLQTLGYVEPWCKDDILAGDVNQQITDAIESAKIILYFFSSDFIGGEYKNLSNLQIQGAPAKDWIYQKYTAEKLLLIPILVSNIAGFKAFDESKFAVPPGASLGGIEKSARNDAYVKIGETIIEYVKKSRGESVEIPLPARRRKMPPLPVSLLPQLCARIEQTDELREVFDKYKTAVSPNEPKRPLVCVIHGNVEECPEGYKARLEKRDIYEFLQMDYEQPIKFCNLGFPYETYDVAEPGKFFEKNLKERFFDDEDKPPENLGVFLNQFRTVIINYDVFSENWNRRVMQSFLDFWNAPPVQNTRATVIVNLFFHYDEGTDFYKKNNLEARNFFNDLKRERLADYRNIRLAITPELDAVQISEVSAWLNNPKVFRDFCSEHTPDFCDRATVQQQISHLYREPKTPRRFVREIEIEVDGQVEIRPTTFIRMLTLSEKLGRLLVDVKKRSHR